MVLYALQLLILANKQCAISRLKLRSSKFSSSILPQCELYPNQYQTCYFKLPYAYSEMVSVTIYNSFGIVVLKINTQCIQGAGEISVQHLVPGMYTIIITDKLTSYTQRIIKK